MHACMFLIICTYAHFGNPNETALLSHLLFTFTFTCPQNTAHRLRIYFISNIQVHLTMRMLHISSWSCLLYRFCVVYVLMFWYKDTYNKSFYFKDWSIWLQKIHINIWGNPHDHTSLIHLCNLHGYQYTISI